MCASSTAMTPSWCILPSSSMPATRPAVVCHATPCGWHWLRFNTRDSISYRKGMRQREQMTYTDVRVEVSRLMTPLAFSIVHTASSGSPVRCHAAQGTSRSAPFPSQRVQASNVLTAQHNAIAWIADFSYAAWQHRGCLLAFSVPPRVP